jgi:hypothetical protein
MHFTIVGALTLLLLSYSLVDVIATDSQLIRNLPKLAWLVVVIFVPFVGPVTWILLGRPKGAALFPGTTGIAPSPKEARRPLAPDDDPDFLRRLNRPGDDPRV